MKISLLSCLSHCSSPRSDSAAWLLLQHCSWPLLQGTGAHNNHPCSLTATCTQTPAANPLYPSAVRAASNTSSRRAGRSEGAAGSVSSRQPSRDDGNKLAPWRAGNHITPPVHFMEGMAAPTALSWLRRRGPEVHHGILYKMFRSRMVRIFSPVKGTVSRVSRSRVLQEGEVLLFPKQLPSEEGQRPIPKPPRAAAAASRAGYEQEQEQELEPRRGGPGDEAWLPPARARSPPSSGPAGGGRQAERHNAAAPAPPGPGQLLLLETDDLVFINKPAMTSVQGPEPGSLETLVTGLKRSPADPDFKLVHRLDRRVSGVMMMARDADAAAWVTACFRDKATQALLQLEEERCNARAREGLPFKPPPTPLPPREPLPEGLSIARTYWALLHGRLEPGDTGRITLPVPLPGAGSGPARPAVTHYRVLASSHKLSWVELSPMTGRRHQLRHHCWKGLGAPIVGDENYGFRGMEQRDVLHADAMDKAWWDSYGPSQAQAQGQQRRAFEPYNSREVPIHLHSKQLTLTFAAQRPLKVTAPAPGYMAALLNSMAWDRIQT